MLFKWYSADQALAVTLRQLNSIIHGLKRRHHCSTATKLRVIDCTLLRRLDGGLADNREVATGLRQGLCPKRGSANGLVWPDANYFSKSECECLNHVRFFVLIRLHPFYLLLLRKTYTRYLPTSRDIKVPYVCGATVCLHRKQLHVTHSLVLLAQPRDDYPNKR